MSDPKTINVPGLLFIPQLDNYLVISPDEADEFAAEDESPSAFESVADDLKATRKHTGTKAPLENENQ